LKSQIPCPLHLPQMAEITEVQDELVGISMLTATLCY